MSARRQRQMCIRDSLVGMELFLRAADDDDDDDEGGGVMSPVGVYQGA